MPYNGKEVKISEYIAVQARNLYIKKVRDELPNTNSKYQKAPHILEDPKISIALFKDINSRIENEILQIYNGHNENEKIIDVDFGNDVSISYDRDELKEIINRLSQQLIHADSSFLDRVRSKVAEKCSEYGIDKKSFCFDTYVVEEFKKPKTTNQSNKQSNKPTDKQAKEITLEDCIKKLKEIPKEKLQEAYIYLENLQQSKTNDGPDIE